LLIRRAGARKVQIVILRRVHILYQLFELRAVYHEKNVLLLEMDNTNRIITCVYQLKVNIDIKISNFERSISLNPSGNNSFSI
jgi:hypothetical protein